MTTRAKRAVLGWLLVCAMMVGLMPVIGGGVYADVISDSQGYDLENVQIANSSANVVFTTESDALLIAAAYDENGRQKMIVNQRVSSEQNEATLTFKKTLSEEDTVKVFMVDSETQNPLCEEYVKEPGVITDSWEEIIASTEDGTYKDKYNIGDTKELDLGSEGIVDMQIVAFDTDELADGSGTAAITWISKQLLKSDHRMNPPLEYNEDTYSYVIGTEWCGGWEYSEMRSWLKNDIKTLFPSIVKNNIKLVKKYSSSWDALFNYTHNAITNDDVWIPSRYEVFGKTVGRWDRWDSYETMGPMYTELFATDDDRIKQKAVESSTCCWWLRSTDDNEYLYDINSDYASIGFCGVGSNGKDSGYYADYERAVALGFCIGSSTEEQVPVEYTVTFNTNGGSAVDAQKVKENEKATEPTAPTKENNTFSGWYSDSELTTEYNFDTVVTENLTLYAKWDEDQPGTVDLGSANVGDYVTFGHYEQDNNLKNGKEPVEWKVLDKKDGRVLLLSKYGLDCKKYNNTAESVTWETSTLRSWLNSTFLNEAFSSSEKSAIPTVSLANPDNPNYGTEGGNNTNDQVFLLNLQEMQHYFNLSDTWTDYDGHNYDVTGSKDTVGGSKDVITSPTAYAKAQGAYTYSSYHDAEGKESCWWWLRSPGYYSTNAAYVNYGGFVYAGGDYVHSDYFAVRPALWVNLAS